MADIMPLPIEIPPWQIMDNRVELNGRAYGNMQWIYRFGNGYGASVVQGPHTYGGAEGMYEMAVIEFDGDDWRLTYETPVTDDVIGWLSIDDVAARLVEIAGLERAHG